MNASLGPIDMTMSRRPARHALALRLMLLSLAIAVAGCGGHPAVTGRVTFVDGSPLTIGEVVLDNGRNMGRGTIMTDGSFVMGFDQPRNGIPAGTYKVAILNATKGGPGNWVVATKYIDPRTSGIEFEVRAGKRNVLNFQVEPNLPKSGR